MKKRSLFAAVAMLIVSAIVLTSTTYAWFSLSNNANVEAVSASVQNASGIQVSADAQNWYSYLSKDMIASAQSFTFPSTLSAVDYNGSSFKKATSLENDTITTAAATANTDYIEFTVYVKAAVGSTIRFKTDDNDTTVAATNSVANVGYADFYYDNTHHYVSTDSDNTDSYNAFGANQVDAAPLVSGIVADTNIASTPMSASTTIANQTFTIPASGYATIVVRMWVEGQDAECYGDFTGGNLTTTMYFSIAPAQQGG